MALARALPRLTSMALLAASVPTLALSSPGSPVNLVANGSMGFVDASNHPLGPGQYRVGSDPNTLTGWTFLNTDPSAEYFVSFQSEPSPEGGSYLGIQDLDSFAPRVNVVGITQQIGGLQVGATYELSLWSMSNHDGSGFFQDWVVTFGGQERTSKQTTPKLDSTGTWVRSTMSFTATSATQALTFVAQYLPGSVPQVLNLDGVVLEEVSPVPEPARWALLLGGLGILLAYSRRRRSPSA